MAAGNVLKSAGRAEEAKASYEAALALDAGYAVAHYNMGALLHAQGGAGGEINSGQLAEARASLQRAIQLDPEYPLPVVSLGDIAMAEADVNAAVEHYAYVCVCPMLCCSDTCC